MRKWQWFLMFTVLSGITWAGSIPAKITYQGTLKDKGVPATGTYTLTFRIKDVSGLTQYWDSGPMSVNVNQGLFAVTLQPTGIDWQNVTPYIEVSVGNPPQSLAPLEPINASVYASLAGDIVDGKVTPQKVASGYGLIPSGFIVMSTMTCPSGWTRFSALDNRFPTGSSTFGTEGGNATHSHSITATSQTDIGVVFNSQQGAGSKSTDWARADHIHAVSTESNLPPYMTVIFCQKL